MKRRDLIKLFTDAGFTLHRHGANHDSYIRGKDIEQIPRHKEVNEKLAKALIKKWGL